MRHTLRNTGIFGFLTLGFLFAGCGAQEPAQEHMSEVKIIRGKPVEENPKDPVFLSTVALTNAELAAKNHSFCSGTVVDPQVILTAAHCLLDMKKQPLPLNHAVVVGNKVTKDSTLLPVTKLVPHPEYSPRDVVSPFPSKPAHDVGLVFLAAPLSSNWKPVSIFTGELSRGVHVTVAGFGVTGSRYINTTGQLRKATVGIRAVWEKFRRFGTAGFFKGACAGDSGGPVFIQYGEETLVTGITSSGIEFYGQCVGLNYFTDARAYAGWVQQEIEQFRSNLQVAKQ